MKISTPQEYAADRRRKQAATRQKRYRQNHPDRVKAYEAQRRLMQRSASKEDESHGE